MHPVQGSPGEGRASLRGGLSPKGRQSRPVPGVSRYCWPGSTPAAMSGCGRYHATTGLEVGGEAAPGCNAAQRRPLAPLTGSEGHFSTRSARPSGCAPCPMSEGAT